MGNSTTNNKTTDNKSLTPRTDNSLESLLDAFQNLNLNPETKENLFINFYWKDNMAKTTPAVKKTELC